MAAGTKVQLRLGDRVVTEVSLRDGELRIGRMKENDLVINNLAVSRFHAVLRRVGAGYEIEDLGSENGTTVAGVQVRGTAPVPSGAQVRIGKHVLTILAGSGEEVPGSGTRKSDAWDAAQTYFAPELAPRSSAAAIADIAEVLFAEAEEGEAVLVAEAVEEGAASAAPVGATPRAVRRPATSLDLPDPEARFAFSEDELLLGQGPDAAPIPHPPSEFDIAAESAMSIPPAGPLYAGLIVERAGRVESVVPMRGSELVVGRGTSCDLMLSTAGISRRHARFVREAEGLRVFDLGSANGLLVNGERANDRLLQLGDVVTLDEYTLTFVLDREPLDQSVRSAAVAASTDSGGHLTVLHSAPLASMRERDLVTESDEEDHSGELEKELEIVAVVATAAAGAASSGAGADVVVEVVLGGEGLPPALRAVLRELAGQELRLPAELRIRRR